ncbi:MAG: class I SAM-dependent methyltransferase [Curvibacter sp.]|jgi:demethylmenaquinone methyltransferase/2-methoxy-6-polyprenyl-1,4-benzoquinol methylase|nr:class I SAM-dependent methyltransferase [Curvibacter sp.]
MRKEDPPQKLRHDSHTAACAMYSWRASGYELQLAPYEFIRRMAINHLALRPGQCVLDLGCGTGMSFPLLREAVGPSGRVVAVDQSPEMLALARLRCERAGWDNVALQCAAAEEALLPRKADAALLHFTHDILQSPQAVDHLLRHLRPGARIVATGLKWTAPALAPWNALVGFYMAQSVTHYDGLRSPWLPLSQRGAQLEVDALVMGTIFVAHGTWPGRRPAQPLEERLQPQWPQPGN